MDRKPVFVTGATGYIGGRLVPRLLEAGWRVRCVARAPEKLQARVWAADERVEVVSGDVENTAELTARMRGCSVAYYLVHSMISSAAFRDHDRELAVSFARAAADAGVERVVYLGGLGETGPDLSEHLASRREVEGYLRSTGVPVTVLRAAIIIGSGSASFEILRYITERLPVMITPRWVRTECQPIAVRNVLTYLVACLEVEETVDATLDIGGPDALTYE
ncbi:MAG: SDR family NAD(P)-dependent oxidoreductase, partial [Acidobacteriota bacterium]